MAIIHPTEKTTDENGKGIDQNDSKDANKSSPNPVWKCKGKHPVYISYFRERNAEIARNIAKLLQDEILTDRKTMHCFVADDCLYQLNQQSYPGLVHNTLRNASVIIIILTDDALNDLKMAHQVSSKILLEYENILELHQNQQGNHPVTVIPIYANSNGYSYSLPDFEGQNYPDQVHKDSSKNIRCTMKELTKLANDHGCKSMAALVDRIIRPDEGERNKAETPSLPQQGKNIAIDAAANSAPDSALPQSGKTGPVSATGANERRERSEIALMHPWSLLGVLMLAIGAYLVLFQGDSSCELANQEMRAQFEALQAQCEELKGPNVTEIQQSLMQNCKTMMEKEVHAQTERLAHQYDARLHNAEMNQQMMKAELESENFHLLTQLERLRTHILTGSETDGLPSHSDVVQVQAQTSWFSYLIWLALWLVWKLIYIIGTSFLCVGCCACLFPQAVEQKPASNRRKA